MALLTCVLMRSKSCSDQAGYSSCPRTSPYHASRLSLCTCPDSRVISLSTCALNPAAIGNIASLISLIDLASEPPSVSIAAVRVARPFLPPGSNPAPACTINDTSISGDEADGLATNETGVASSGATSGTGRSTSPAAVTVASLASAIPAAATSSSSEVIPSIAAIVSSLDSVSVTRELSTKYLFAVVRRSSAERAS